MHLLTYLLTCTVGSGIYKTGNISETVEATIDGLYKVVHGLSIAAKCMTIFKVTDSLNAAK